MKPKREQKYHNPPSLKKYMIIAGVITVILTVLATVTANTYYQENVGTVIWFSIMGLIPITISTFWILKWRIHKRILVSYQQPYTIPVYITLLSGFLTFIALNISAILFWGSVYSMTVVLMACVISVLPFAVMTHLYLNNLKQWQLQKDNKMKSGQPDIKLQSLDSVENHDEA